MRRTLTWKLGVIIVGVIVVSLMINSITTYKTAYDSLYEAAGIEAYGCASITTGLLDTQDIEDLIRGQRNAEIGQKLSWTVDHKSIFENQYILDLDGTILALDKNLQAQGFNVGDAFYMDEEAVQMLLDMKHATYSHIYEFGGMERLSGYAPIYKNHDPSQDIVAISVIDFNAQIVSDRTWTVVKSGIILGSIPLLLAAVITLFLIRLKTKPISQLIQHTKRIAEGDIRKHDLHVTSQDEVGDLARNLDQMSDQLRDMIITIKEASDHLVASTSETSKAMEEISTALGQVSGNMDEVASNTSAGAEQTSNASNALVNLAELIKTSQAKAELSVDHADHTMATAELGLQKVHDIADHMDIIKSSTLSTSEMIQTLNNYTHEIQNITVTIANISKQTNLLALNAAIEAAQAGEHGRGFAIVAGEVRKLAEQSSKEAAVVDEMAAQITATIAKTVERVEASRLHVEEGELMIKDTGSALMNIKQSVDQIAEEIQSLSQLTHDETDTSKVIVELVQRLEHLNETISTSTEEVSAATEQTTASVEEIATRTNKISAMSHQLSTIVNQFKL